MKSLFCLVCLTGLCSFFSGSKKECLKITCLNLAHTVSENEGERISYFLIESLGDTISNFDIRSACGCEYPLWKKDMQVFPNHPDTVIIVSSLKGHSGHWFKQTSISAGNCIIIFNTGPWTVTKSN
jgi:hypothetical protein